MIIFVCGTDTEVGKTMATATICSLLTAAGRTVAAYKPVQTGMETYAQGDMEIVQKLSGCASAGEGARLRLPMAPLQAVKREQATLPPLKEHVHKIKELAAAGDVVVEGAGGLLVDLGVGFNLADLAAQFPDARIIIVTRSNLGTLNHTLLTINELSRRGLADQLAGLIIGSWPQQPSIIETDNLEFFTTNQPPLLGVLPAGLGQLTPAQLQAQASKILSNFPTVLGVK